MTTPNAPSVRRHHVLVVGDRCEWCDPNAVEPDDRDCGGPHHYPMSMECPYPPDRRPLPCATWEQCGCQMPPVADDEDRPDEHYDEAECPSTGLTHRYFVEFDELLAPTGECWPANHDDLDGEAHDLDLPPGRHEVAFTCEDECTLVLELLPRAEAAA